MSNISAPAKLTFVSPSSEFPLLKYYPWHKEVQVTQAQVRSNESLFLLHLKYLKFFICEQQWI